MHVVEQAASGASGASAVRKFAQISFHADSIAAVGATVGDDSKTDLTDGIRCLAGVVDGIDTVVNNTLPWYQQELLPQPTFQATAMGAEMETKTLT
jgi:hypothetical protein